MEKTIITNQGGIGFVGLLQLIFITLKLCKIITWSWFWVLSPIWISILFVILVLFIVIAIYTIWRFFKK